MGLVATLTALAATYDHTTTDVTASDVVQVSPNTQTATLEMTVACTGYNGAVVTAQLYGTNDDTALTTPDTAQWTAIPYTNFTTTANGSAYAPGNSAAVAQSVFVAKSPSTVITNQATAAEAAFDRNYTFPANSLVLGSTVRVHAVIKRVAENNADTSTYHVRLGGTGGTLIAQSVAVTAAGFVVIDAEFTVAAPGSGGSINGAALAWYRIAQTVGVVNAVPTATPIQAAAVDTTLPQQLVVTTSQSAQSAGNQDQLLTLVVEQIGGGAQPLDIRPYKYLRLSQVVIGAPTADVDVTASLNVIRYTPGQVLADTLTVAIAHTGPVVTPSAAVALPADATSLGAEVQSACTDYNGATLTAKVQVSNDDATWLDLPGGSVSFTANGSAYVAGASSTNALNVLGYRYFRVTASVSGAPNADATMTVRYKVQRQDYPTSS
jgi:hypothetical protein